MIDVNILKDYLLHIGFVDVYKGISCDKYQNGIISIEIYHSGISKYSYNEDTKTLITITDDMSTIFEYDSLYEHIGTEDEYKLFKRSKIIKKILK